MIRRLSILKYALLLLLAAPVSAQTKPLTARDYYNELKAANEFKHYSDTYVCFSDDDNPGFAVISRGSDIIDEMKNAKQKPSAALVQEKNALFVNTYFKGVANGLKGYDPVGNDGAEWSLTFSTPLHGKMVYSINWTTGRYRLRVYALDHSKTLPGFEASGKCELIHGNSARKEGAQ